MACVRLDQAPPQACAGFKEHRAPMLGFQQAQASEETGPADCSRESLLNACEPHFDNSSATVGSAAAAAV